MHLFHSLFVYMKVCGIAFKSLGSGHKQTLLYSVGSEMLVSVKTGQLKIFVSLPQQFEQTFGYFLSISQEEVSADIIPNSAFFGIFSQEQKEQRHTISS